MLKGEVNNIELDDFVQKHEDLIEKLSHYCIKHDRKLESTVYLTAKGPLLFTFKYNIT
jgi:hypothetical protein